MSQLRKVYRSGNSVVVAIPEWMLNEHGIKVGDLVIIEHWPGQFIAIQKASKDKIKGTNVEKGGDEPMG